MKTIKLICLFILLSLGGIAQNFIGETSYDIETNFKAEGITPTYSVTDEGDLCLTAVDKKAETVKLYYFNQGSCYMYCIAGQYPLLKTYVNTLNSLGVKEFDGTWTIYSDTGAYTSWVDTKSSEFFIILTVRKTN